MTLYVGCSPRRASTSTFLGVRPRREEAQTSSIRRPLSRLQRSAFRLPSSCPEIVWCVVMQRRSTHP